MGSIHDTASTSSASSSSSSVTCQGSSPSTHRTSKRKSYPPVSVAALRRRFEGLQTPAADQRAAVEAVNRRRRSGDGTPGWSEIAAAVDEHKSKRRSSSARPAADVSRSTGARRSVAAGSPQLPASRGRPVIPVCKRSSQEPELIISRRDQGNLHLT